MKHLIQVQKYISTEGFTSPSLRCKMTCMKKIGILGLCDRSGAVCPHSTFLTEVVHPDVLLRHGYKNVCPLHPDLREQVGAWASKSEFECPWVYMCVAGLVQSVHISWALPAPSLWTAKCHTGILLISLKNGLSECNSCCMFGPYLDLTQMCKAVLVLRLKFIFFLISKCFSCTGLSHFQVCNMSCSYLTIIALEKLLSSIIYHRTSFLLYKMISALRELRFQCSNIFLNSGSWGGLMKLETCIYGEVYTPYTGDPSFTSNWGVVWLWTAENLADTRLSPSSNKGAWHD